MGYLMKDSFKKSAALAAEKFNRLSRELFEVGYLRGQLEVREKLLEELKKEIEPQIQREMEFMRKDMSLRAGVATILEVRENNQAGRQKEWFSAGEIRAEMRIRFSRKYGPSAVRKCLVSGEGDLFERKGESKGTKWRYIGKISSWNLFKMDLNATDEELKELG